jgi:hypothetical protein
MRSTSVRPYLEILLSGLPAPRPYLTARELARCVELIGKGWTLADAIDQIQAERPTLPFDQPVVDVTRESNAGDR